MLSIAGPLTEGDAEHCSFRRGRGGMLSIPHPVPPQGPCARAPVPSPASETTIAPGYAPAEVHYARPAKVPAPRAAARGKSPRKARKLSPGANGTQANRDGGSAACDIPRARGHVSPPAAPQLLLASGKVSIPPSPRGAAAAAAEPGQDTRLSPGKPPAPNASIPRKAITAQQITGLIKSHYAISESKSDPGAAD